MAFILSTDTFDNDTIGQISANIQAYASQLIPNADFTKGTALYDLLIRPAAILQFLAEVNVNRARTAGSLLKISQYPMLADNDQVNELLSNYRIARRAGTTATGSVEILISTNVITAIPSGAVFTSGGLRFFTQQSYVGVPDQSLVSSSTDRLIQPVGSGVYSFLVDVVAELPGSAYQLSQTTSLVLQTPPSNYISARAAYDFTTGVGQETTEELMARLEPGLANRTPGNRTNIIALIQQTYPVLNTSIIGYGQPEMTREQDNLFLFSYGGKSDIYVQTVYRPQVVRVTKSAVLVNKAQQKWQVFFNRDEFAGVYRVNAVQRMDAVNVVGTLTMTLETRNTDTHKDNPDSFAPHIDSYTQAAFSRFQTCTIEFIDPTQDTSTLAVGQSMADYYVDILVMPQIADIQDGIFSNPDIRAHRYDDLVRAPIPALVSITLGMRLSQGSSVNEQAVKQAIADRINQLGFRSKLSASYAIDTAAGLLGSKDSVLLPIDMLGEVISPVDGSSTLYRSSTEINVPADYTKGISEKTLMFFCDPANISLYIERV